MLRQHKEMARQRDSQEEEACETLGIRDVEVEELRSTLRIHLEEARTETEEASANLRISHAQVADLSETLRLREMRLEYLSHVRVA